MRTRYTSGSLQNYDPLKQYFLFMQKKCPGLPLIIPQQNIFSTDFAHFDLGCTPTTVVQPYLQMLKVFDHPLNDKDLKNK